MGKMTEKERQEIDSQARRWVNLNTSLTCSGGGHYSSPRLSSEYLDCSMPLTFDTYSFCSFGCRYCFAAFFKANNPMLKGEGLKLKGVDVKKIEKMLS